MRFNRTCSIRSLSREYKTIIFNNLYGKIKRIVSNFSDTTALLAAIVCAVQGGVTHILMDCHAGGSPLRIVGAVWSLLGFLIILNRWTRFNVFFRILSILVLLVASRGIVGFLSWLCNIPAFYDCIPCEVFEIFIMY